MKHSIMFYSMDFANERIVTMTSSHRKCRRALLLAVIMTSGLAGLADSFGIEGGSVFSGHGRSKREIDCDRKYREITTGHTACLSPSSSFKAGDIDDSDRKIIVDVHNVVRRDTAPAAADMMLLSWDDRLENIAQRWAERCVFNHDENYKRYDFGRFSVGQNLAWSTQKLDWSEAIALWSGEKKDYDFTMNASPTGKVVGHYTQMVWASTVKVGCGYAFCGNRHYYVCNYGPGGNLAGKKPYLAGAQCSSCPTRCNNGLCDCKGEVCLNGGTLDFTTCTCKCPSNLPFYLYPTCGLNCTNAVDPYQCDFYGVSKCETYTNVPQECPNMCKWCPSAAFIDSDNGSPRTVQDILITVAVLFFVRQL